MIGTSLSQVSVMVKMVGAESTVILKESVAVPVCSPDGRWIVFDRRPNWFAPSRTTVIVTPRIGGGERTITNVRHSFSGGFFAWTLDSQALITYDREQEGTPYHLVLVSLDNGEKYRLTSPPSIVGGDFGPASPDGKILAFWRQTSGKAGDLYLLDPDAAYRPEGQPRKLDTGLPLSNWPVWTRDGKEIIFCPGEWCYSSLWRIRADGSGPAKHMPFGGEGAFQPNLAIAGDRLVYLKHVADKDIWRVELLFSGLPARAAEKLISSSRPDNEPAWSPDARSIAFVSQRAGHGQIWVCSSNGSDLRQLTSIESSFLKMMPCWSPMT